jgi:hypothetical protein
MSHTDDLARLAELHRNGDLTDDEFMLAKRKLLGIPASASSPIEDKSESSDESVEEAGTLSMADQEEEKGVSAKENDATVDKLLEAKSPSLYKWVIGCAVLLVIGLIAHFGKNDSPTSSPIQSPIPSSPGYDTNYNTQAPATPALATPAPSVTEPNQPYATPEPSIPDAIESKLELQHFSWGESEYGGVATLSGSVKNITNEKLEDVEVVGLFYDKNEELITSNDVLIPYNPILPGQISPFEVMVPWNPAMRRANIEFKELMGGTIPWRQKEKKKK